MQVEFCLLDQSIERRHLCPFSTRASANSNSGCGMISLAVESSRSSVGLGIVAHKIRPRRRKTRTPQDVLRMSRPCPSLDIAVFERPAAPATADNLHFCRNVPLSDESHLANYSTKCYSSSTNRSAETYHDKVNKSAIARLLPKLRYPRLGRVRSAR